MYFLLTSMDGIASVILCISVIVHMAAFVNLLLKKMMMMAGENSTG